MLNLQYFCILLAVIYDLSNDHFEAAELSFKTHDIFPFHMRIRVIHAYIVFATVAFI